MSSEEVNFIAQAGANT